MRLLWRGFHTLIKNTSFSSPTDVRSHNPPSFGAQRPRYRSFPSPIDVGLSTPPSGFNFLAGTLPDISSDTICNSPNPSRYWLLWVFPFRFPLKVFKMHMLERDFHTFIKKMLCSPPQPIWNLTLNLFGR